MRRFAAPRLPLVGGLVLLTLSLLATAGHPLSADPLPLPDVYQFSLQAPWPGGVLNAPDGVTVADDGSVLVMDTENHRVQRFAPDGTLINTWSGLGSGEGETFYPRGIVVAPDDWVIPNAVYVVDSLNQRIQRYRLDGRFETQWGYAGNGQGGLWWPWDAALASDGAVYVTDVTLDLVQVFDADGRFLFQWGGSGSSAGQLSSPQGIAISAEGEVYVIERGNGRVQVFGLDGKHRRQWPVEGITSNRIGGGGVGVEIGPNGDVYVTAVSRVLRFSPDGELLGEWEAAGDDDVQMTNPVGIDLAADGTAYVVDRSSDRVWRFAPDGAWVDSLGRDVELPFAGVSDIARAPDGSLFVLNRGREVLHLSSEGALLGTFTIEGEGVSRFQAQPQLAAAPDSSVYITDAAQSRVLHYSAEGQLLGILIDDRSGAPIDSPSAIAVNHRGRVFVGESQQVLAVRPDGSLAATIGVGQLQSVDAIAAAPDGSLLVLDASIPRGQGQGQAFGRMYRYSPNGALLDEWGELGEEPGQWGAPAGMTVAPDGTVFVSDGSLYQAVAEVERYTLDGQHLGTFGTDGVDETEFRGPGALAADERGRLYVGDGMGQLHVFGPHYAGRWHIERRDNPYGAGFPTVVEHADGGEIRLEWPAHAAEDEVPAVGRTMHAVRYQPFAEEFYELTVEADGGARMWLGDQLLLDQYDEDTVSWDQTIIGDGQDATLRLEVRTGSSAGTLRLSVDGPNVEPPTPTPGPTATPPPPWIFLPQLHRQ